MRAFLAFELPDDLKQGIVSILSYLRKTCPRGIKWVADNNLHITIQFIGTITTEQRERIQTNLIPVFSELKSIEICSPQIEVIPRNNPRLIWVNFQHNSSDLLRIINTIRKSLQNDNIFIDTKPFNLHVTLGRIKNAVPGHLIPSIVSQNLTDDKWAIRVANLYESRLHPNGPEYIKLKKFSLKGD